LPGKRDPERGALRPGAATPAARTGIGGGGHLEPSQALVYPLGWGETSGLAPKFLGGAEKNL